MTAVRNGVDDDGIAVLEFGDVDGAGPSEDLLFNALAEERVEVPGRAFSLRIRPAVGTGERVLMVSDGWGGLRLYQEEE